MTNVIVTTLVTTVDSVKNKYSVRQYSNAKADHLLKNTIGGPSTEDLIKYIEGNMIPNCNITRDDIMHVEDILGLNLGSLKVKIKDQPNMYAQHGVAY